MRGNVKSKFGRTLIFLFLFYSSWIFTRHSSEAGRSLSPASEVGNISDDSRNVKGKGKSKSKRAGK